MVVFSRQSALSGLVEVTSHSATPLRSDDPQRQQWRVLRFNETSRQSVSRVTEVAGGGGWEAVPDCLAQEYLKTMVCVGTALLHASGVRFGQTRLLCLGAGGGSLPLFLSHHFPGAEVDAVEHDPTVAEAAHAAMGLPEQIPNLTFHVCDAVDFLRKGGSGYDAAFLDMFGGDDCVPSALASPRFAALLSQALKPGRGVVVMNLHGAAPGSLISELHAALGGPRQACSLELGCKLQPRNRTLAWARGWLPPDDA
eukprot:CAMPEP_0177616464 /NCGR_PEP_ID=MMETSP0419_2-20121207/24179_1 /TAXON_ID=582737 /ORGANISM="Tetraselmis sp., Strain GSL018" /LENGTH=253 /DNA_ID=CAMNT_0019114543 /DNA_START=457 /DNA_END=1214 /DNA_ORIENTATION=+